MAIGKTNPSYKFEVSNGTIDGAFNPDASSSTLFLGSTTSHRLILGTNYSGHVAINTSGLVGIGELTPTSLLDVKGSGVNADIDVRETTGIRTRLISYSGSPLNFGAVGTVTNHEFRIFSDNTLAILVDTAQNVAIGNTGAFSPLGKLDSRATSGAQIVASYDGSNYTTITTNSSGVCTISPSGDGFIIDAAGLRVNQAPAGAAGAATGTYLAINLNGTDYKIALLANA